MQTKIQEQFATLEKRLIRTIKTEIHLKVRAAVKDEIKGVNKAVEQNTSEIKEEMQKNTADLKEEIRKSRESQDTGFHQTHQLLMQMIEIFNRMEGMTQQIVKNTTKK